MRGVALKMLFILPREKNAGFRVTLAAAPGNPGSAVWLVCDRGRLSLCVSPGVLLLLWSEDNSNDLTGQLWGLVEIVYIKIKSVFLSPFSWAQALLGPVILDFWKAEHIRHQEVNTYHSWYLLNDSRKNEWARVKGNYPGTFRAIVNRWILMELRVKWQRAGLECIDQWGLPGTDCGQSRTYLASQASCLPFLHPHDIKSWSRSLWIRQQFAFGI